MPWRKTTTSCSRETCSPKTRSDRQRPLRARAGGSGESKVHAGVVGSGLRCLGERPRLPAQGRRVHQRRDQIDKDLYELEPAEAAKVKSMPGSLDQALDALEKDHDFLLKGDVFTKDVIEVWLEYKRKKEVDAIRLRPHPYEFALYFDI